MIFTLILFTLLLIGLSYKFKLVRQALLISLITIVLTIFAYQISDTSLFKVYVYPESFALEDYEITDYAFEHLRPNPQIDERIVLVNYGQLSRGGVARLLEIASKYKPKVIGLDAVYNCENGLRDSVHCPQSLDTLGNRRFSEAIKTAENVVLASRVMQSNRLVQTETERFDSLEQSDPLFTNFSRQAFVSLPVQKGLQDDIILCREMWPSMVIRGRTEYSFSLFLAKMYDSIKAKRFIERGKELETINYRRQLNQYAVLDAEDILKENFTPDLLTGKVLIFGYIGDYLDKPSYEEMFYVPLGKRVAGRGMPNMHSAVVHANIISMILDEDYLDRLSDTQEFIVAFLLCFIHVLLLLIVFNKLPVWYDLLAVSLVIVQLGFYSWLRLFLFTEFNLQISLVATITSLAIASIAVVLYKELLPYLMTKIGKKRSEVESAG